MKKEIKLLKVLRIHEYKQKDEHKQELNNDGNDDANMKV